MLADDFHTQFALKRFSFCYFLFHKEIIFYSNVTSVPCGNNFSAGVKSRNFSTPFYPLVNYKNDLSCEWLIQSSMSTNQRILLSLSGRTEKEYDLIKVRTQFSYFIYFFAVQLAVTVVIC